MNLLRKQNNLKQKEQKELDKKVTYLKKKGQVH